MFKRRIYLLSLIAILTLAIGCSGDSTDPVTPQPAQERVIEQTRSHNNWGLWQFSADPENETLDVVKLREGDLHLNALHFLEPPANLYLALDGPPDFNGGVMTVDIGLRHPFLGLERFTGFDARGILIGNGSIGTYVDSGLLLPGEMDTRIVNPDGLTRWWNPTEFPPNETKPITGYIDGLLGTPDSQGNYSATLNGYKYFTDGLDVDEDISSVDPLSRGVFSAGQKNVRRYEISLAGGMEFNYAVDASWAIPTGQPPYAIPDDFPENANAPEAYRISIVEDMNSLWNNGVGSGGGLNISIDVYDWFDADLNSVKVESPGNLTAVTSPTPTGGGTGYSTYEIEIEDATPTENSIDLLVTVESEAMGYGGLLPGKAVSVYFTYSVSVGDTPPSNAGLVALADANAYEIPPNGTVQFNGSHSYDDNGYTIVDYTWNFGDSSPEANGEFTSHQYTSVNLFTVTLTVENEIGQQDVDTIGIIVVDAAGKNGRHLSATYYTGDLDSSKEEVEKRSTDHMYLNNYWIMQNGTDLVGFNMDQAPGGNNPPQLNPVITLVSGITGLVYSVDCGLDDRVAWADESDTTTIHIIDATGATIVDIDAPSNEDFLAADFDVDDDLWVVTQHANGEYWAHQYIKGDSDTYDLVDIWSHELVNIAAATDVFEIQVLHSTESMYTVSDPLPGNYTSSWPISRIDVFDRFGDHIRSYAPSSYWSPTPTPWPHVDIELDSTNPALEGCRLNWYQTYQQPAGYYCNSYRRLTLLLANISINFDQCSGRFQAMDISNTTKRLESIDLDSDQYRYWTTIPTDW